jgi:hypothetical protein
MKAANDAANDPPSLAYLSDESIFVREDADGSGSDSGSVAIALPGAPSLRCVHEWRISVALRGESDHAVDIIVASEQVERSTLFPRAVFKR